MGEQLRILKEIQEGGWGVVTCGMCGAVMLVYSDEDMHQCVKCNFTGANSDFPDIVTIGDIEFQFIDSKEVN